MSQPETPPANVAKQRTCSQCGRPLPSGVPAGLCPVCNLRGALDDQEAASGGPLEAIDFGPPAEKHGSSAPLGVFGDYELIEEIARGGMGVVYKARQVSLDRVVAVKTILAGELATPEFIRRFRAEAAAAAVLHHPNIVAIHEVGVHAGKHFFSMDLVEGPSLAALVGHVPLPARRAAQYVNAIAKAVHYAHENGILHRDLKPSNVLIDADNQPRITDFGLAKRLEGASSLTVSGPLIGSPNFMPPEQASAKHGRVGRRSDVYGLGGILYHLLTARPPFQADSVEAVVSQLLTADPVYPRLLNHSVPRDLETICLKCLEKEPGRRYATAEALAEELDRFLAGKPIRARPIGPLGKVWRWARRNPLPASLAVALALVFAAGLGGVLWQWRKATERLWESYLAQAHANRWSGRAGRRFDSLVVLRRAAAIQPSMELRNEAIACLTLSDGREGKTWLTATNSLAVFDPGCQRYAYWNPPEGLSIVRVADGAELLRLADREETVGTRFLCFSPDGERLAAASTNSERFRVRVWDLPRRAVRYDTVLDGARPTVAFSPDSRLLVAGDKHGVVRVFDLVAQREAKRLQVMPSAMHLVFDPTGTRLAVSGVFSRDVQVIEFDTGKTIATLPHPEGVAETSWHPDGVQLATPCEDFRVRIWDVPSRSLRMTLEGHTSVPKAVKFNHAGDLLASTGWDGVTRFWDLIRGKEQFSLPGGWPGVSTFSSDDSQLPFGPDPPKLGIWQIATGRECRRLGLAGRTYNAAFSADGRLLATSHDDGARLWDIMAGHVCAVLPAQGCRCVLFHPGGLSLVLSGYMGLQQWPLQTSEDADALTLRIGPPQTLLDLPLEQARWLPDGQALVVAGPHGVRVIELGPPLRMRHHCQHPNAASLAISGDGNWIASGTWMGEGVRIWNVRTANLVTNLALGLNVAVAFSPNGRWLVTGSPLEYRFWRVGSWEPVHAIRRYRTDRMFGIMAFSPDAQTLALVRGRNSDLRLVEADTGREWAAIEAGDPHCFSAHGNRLVTCEPDGLVRLWDLRRIRQQLAAMNLDWDAPLGEPEPPFASEKPLRIVVEVERHDATHPIPTANERQ